MFYGEPKELHISLVPGSTPLLLAKRQMADWGVVQDFRHAKIMLADRPEKSWQPVEIGEKGHFLFDLLGEFSDTTKNDETYFMDEKEVWCCQKLQEIDVFKLDMKYRRLRFLLPVPKYVEIFVDASTLTSEILRRAVHGYGIEVSLPEYDLRKKVDRTYLLEWLAEERPAHVFLAPPCTTWSKMQRRSNREDQVEQRGIERENQEKTFLKLVADIFLLRREQGLPTTMEHPHDADSWKTNTLKQIEEFTKDIVIDRCSTGLTTIEDGKEKPVRKRTRLRTTCGSMVDLLQDAKCQCHEEHGQLRGEQLRRAQNYELSLWAP
jgi:hypothetical protein